MHRVSKCDCIFFFYVCTSEYVKDPHCDHIIIKDPECSRTHPVLLGPNLSSLCKKKNKFVGIRNFCALQDLESLKNVNIVCFMTGSTIFNRLGVTAS